MSAWPARSRKWPMRTVVDRCQVFRASQQYPDGYVLETLECGHELREDIASARRAAASFRDMRSASARMRRCRECYERARQERRHA